MLTQHNYCIISRESGYGIFLASKQKKFTETFPRMCFWEMISILALRNRTVSWSVNKGHAIRILERETYLSANCWGLLGGMPTIYELWLCDLVCSETKDCHFIPFK